MRSVQPKPRARCSPGRPGRPGRPDADWFFVFFFRGASSRWRRGRWEARARLLGRVWPGAPGVGTEGCRGTATRGRLCGLLPGAHRALPARLLCSSGVAGKSGRSGGALRRPHLPRPSADPQAPAAPAGGWGRSALQAACLGPRPPASPRLRLLASAGPGMRPGAAPLGTSSRAQARSQPQEGWSLEFDGAGFLGVLHAPHPAHPGRLARRPGPGGRRPSL